MKRLGQKIGEITSLSYRSEEPRPVGGVLHSWHWKMERHHRDWQKRANHARQADTPRQVTRLS